MLPPLQVMDVNGEHRELIFFGDFECAASIITQIICAIMSFLEGLTA